MTLLVVLLEPSGGGCHGTLEVPADSLRNFRLAQARDELTGTWLSQNSRITVGPESAFHSIRESNYTSRRISDVKEPTSAPNCILCARFRHAVRADRELDRQS